MVGKVLNATELTTHLKMVKMINFMNILPQLKHKFEKARGKV